jgi:wyosine [tRNA(Phe)-imidazoG37] synthetase (radical SAM superfamily)
MVSFHEEYKTKLTATNVCTLPPFPKRIKIESCGVCNHSCIICPCAVQEEKHGIIDDNLCRRIIYDAFNAGARELSLSLNGEPLLNPKLQEYISLAKNVGYDYVFINTNGELLDRDTASILLDANLDCVKVSVNAGNPESYRLIHGSDCFESVIENILLFNKLRNERNQQCKLFVSFIATKENLYEAGQLRFKIDKHVDDFIVINAFSRGWLPENVAFETSLLGNDDYSISYPCGQLFDTAVVLAEGYLVVCCQDLDKSTVIADLREISIKDAWVCDKFVSFRKKYLNKDFQHTLCHNCLFGDDKKVEPLTPALAHYPINELKVADRAKRIDMLRKLNQTELNLD